MTVVECDIDYLIEEINKIVPKFSVLTDKPCKYCHCKHTYISVDCGTPVYWFNGEKPIIEGPHVEAPEGSIYFEDWIRGQR